MAFQSMNWKDVIKDPLPDGKLADTVKALNLTMKKKEIPLRFERLGAGKKVGWRKV